MLMVPNLPNNYFRRGCLESEVFPIGIRLIRAVEILLAESVGNPLHSGLFHEQWRDDRS